MQLEIWEKYGVKVLYNTAYTAKVICHKRIWGSYVDGYRMCPEIANQLLKNNPISVIQWLRNLVDNNFVSLCVVFKASLDGFEWV